MTLTVMKPTACWLLLVVVAVAAFGLRVIQLDRRPMHHDEANQAVRTGLLQETGVYHYDPQDHHGPTLYYLTAPLLQLSCGRDFSGTTETLFRLVPVLFGVGLILLLAWIVDGLGWPAVLVSAGLTAISPAMVYYSRYFVHEMLFVFFTSGCLIALWRWTRTGTLRWAVATGVMAGLMFATKETCVITFFSMVVALEVAGVWSGSRRGVLMSSRLRPAHVVLGGVAALVVAGMFYSSFFTHSQGLADSVQAYRSYFIKGVSSGNHTHPWSYYWHLLGWFREGQGPVFSEGLILALAAIGAGFILMRRPIGSADPALLRFLLVYTVLMIVIYSAIAHKSPWLILSFLHGLILLAGIGAVALVGSLRRRSWKVAASLLLLAGAIQLTVQSWRCNFQYESDPRNPYAYVQTSRDFLKLVKRVQDVAGLNEIIAVVSNDHDAWPLPWYLRKFRQAGYWQNASDMPAGLKPAVIVTSMDRDQPLDGYQAEIYGLRPGTLLNLHIRNDLWAAFLSRQENQ